MAYPCILALARPPLPSRGGGRVTTRLHGSIGSIAMSSTWDTTLDALRRRLGRLIPRLAADFPGWDFTTQPVHDGLALVAVRREQAGEPGTVVVITDDPGELRQMLGGTS